MIIGHKRILDFFKKSVESGKLAHAYLFVGPSNLGKKSVALEFIKMLNGREIEKAVHPDILIVEPEVVEKSGVKKEMEIGIAQAKKIQRQLSLSPYSSDYKIALVNGAEKMTNQAANCLLKTLEEPAGKAILILISSDIGALLPTIVSRCQMVKFMPVKKEDIAKGVGEKVSEQVIGLANGRPGLAIRYKENPSLLREQNNIILQLEKLIRAGISEKYKYAEGMSKDIPRARWVLSCWLFWFRDLMLLSSGCDNLILYPQSVKYNGCYSLVGLKKIIKEIRKTDWLLSSPGINHRLALEVLMLEV